MVAGHVSCAYGRFPYKSFNSDNQHSRCVRNVGEAVHHGLNAATGLRYMAAQKLHGAPDVPESARFFSLHGGAFHLIL